MKKIENRNRNHLGEWLNKIQETEKLTNRQTKKNLCINDDLIQEFKNNLKVSPENAKEVLDWCNSQNTNIDLSIRYFTAKQIESKQL